MIASTVRQFSSKETKAERRRILLSLLLPSLAILDQRRRYDFCSSTAVEFHQFGPSLSTPEMSSEARDKGEFAESKHQNWNGLRKNLKHEFLRLVRIRDFLSLILTYPVRMPDQHLLEKWRDEAQAITTEYSEHMDSIGTKAYRWMHLLSEKPLRYMEVLIPNDIILSKIEDGQMTDDVTPKVILNFAADLAVDQMIQTLVLRNIHHIRLSTRNDIEKIAVKRKIEAALNNKQEENKINSKYSKVLWVDISKYHSNLEVRVRQEIARQLNLTTMRGDWTEGKDNFLKERIKEEMMSTKHLVFLVDGNGGRKLDPRKLDLPKKSLAGAVVWITVDESSVQEHDGLAMGMDLEIRTRDHILSWELFCRKVGNDMVRSSSAICRIARQIVNKCHGHLLAIVLVAGSLNNVDNVQLWKLALKKLCYLHPFYDNRIHNDMSKVMVNAFVNIIWNCLSKTRKLCLKCSLYVLRTEQKMASHLLISSWVYYKLVNSREEAELIFRDLVDSCILLQSKGMYVEWPKEIYHVLKSLLMLNPLDKIKHGGLELTEPPIAEEWFCATHIELMDNKLSELPQSPSCPYLSLLLLQGNANLMEIPTSFFHLMPHLLVLDLSYTSIRSLPSSFFNLQKLKELHLKGCKRFMELSPEIGQLKSLEILDLDHTPITCIPEQIQELGKLKKLILFLYACRDMMKSQLYLVPPGVISKLTHLCYLRIDVSPGNMLWAENIEAILHDISQLQELIALSLMIPQVELLKHVPKWLDFRFVVGCHTQRRIISRVLPAVEAKFKKSSCSLRFVNGEDIIPDEIYKALLCSQALFLERHRTINNLSQIGMENLAHLQSFIVGECNEMQTLIDGGCSCCPVLHWRFLCVFYMNNLRNICQVKACFYQMKTIALHTCPKLTTILTTNFLGSLIHLEEIIVEDCPKVSALITIHEPFESKEEIFLPRLKKVSLLHLPKLVSISSGLCMGPNVEEMEFYDCPELQILSSAELCSQNVKVIRGEKQWWDALEWGEEGRPNYLHRIFVPISRKSSIMVQLLEDEDESASDEADVTDQLDSDDVSNKSDDDENSRSNKIETSHDADHSLLPCLGRDNSIACLLRCSRSDYGSLALLNRSFRNLIRSGELYKWRRQVGIIEHWVYLSCSVSEWEAYDPNRQRWIRLPRMACDEVFMVGDKECLAVGTELLVFGRALTSHLIYRYSLLTNSWSSGMRLNVPRCLFGSGSLGEIAILAGGCDLEGRILSSAELYNSESQTWEKLPNMNKARKMCSGVFMDGKFYVIGGIGSDSELLTCGEEYNLQTRTWTEIPSMSPPRHNWKVGIVSSAPPMVAAVKNELYAADYGDKEVKRYDKERKLWFFIGRLPERIVSMNGWGVAFRACGNGLINMGGTVSVGEGCIELYSCVPSDDSEGPPLQWEMLARKHSELIHPLNTEYYYVVTSRND
ncbi:disease resistance protein [Senna tora]|uniref:Disease resistance protein n=1 Tax=Senna tora TaxID=362788 RepID=A0A835CH29_9FABA|nr:disease resistance protein [Senna tora]